MPCSSSRRSLAALHFSGSPTSTGTMWVSLGITGRPRRVQHRLHARGAILVALALPVRSLEVADRRGRRGADRRRQRGREDEARRIGAHRVDQRGAARDIAAEAAERLGERALDHVDAVHGAVALGRCRRRAGRTCRPHALRRHRSWRRSARRDRRSRGSARCRRPSNRGSRTRSASAAPARRPAAALRDARDRCAARSASRAGLAHALDHRIVVERVGEDQAVRASAWRWSRCRSRSTRSRR